MQQQKKLQAQSNQQVLLLNKKSTWYLICSKYFNILKFIFYSGSITITSFVLFLQFVPIFTDHIGGVMFSMLSSSVVDLASQPSSGQIGQ
jgi:hypothetical protein